LKLCLALAAGILGGVLFHYLSPSSVQAQSPGAADQKLHLVDTFTTRGRGVILAVDNIDRNASMIQPKGRVEIKLRPSNPDLDLMVLRADEADYNRQTDEIVPRGNLRVTFERAN
jgi:lipopolysaccharide assembly outer membrane protein LptD (OstA)